MVRAFLRNEGSARPWVGAESALPGGGSGAARLCRQALGVFVFAILSGGAFAADIATRSLEVCAAANPESGAVLKHLTDLGWQAVHPSNLSDEDVLGIATRMLGEQMGYGTMPKARWTTAWANITKSAEGTRKRFVISDTAQTSFILSGQNGLGVLEISISDYPRLASVFCDITVDKSLSAQSLALVAKEQIKPDHPPIIYASNQELSPDPHHREVFITYYHREKLAELIETDLPFVGTISVRNSLRR